MDQNALIDGMKSNLRTAVGFTGTPSLPKTVVVATQALIADGAPNCALVAMTNLAATATDNTIQPDILKKRHGGVDLRSLYKKTTRPVLSEIIKALGVTMRLSKDPFVSNPFREEKVDENWVEERGNKLAGAEELRVLLAYASANPRDALEVLCAVGKAYTEKLQLAKISYNLPPRITTHFAAKLLNDWMCEQSSKGSRLEITATAVLRYTGGQMSGGWSEVESHEVNDSTPYDQICRHRGSVVALSECKDQPVTASHVNQLSDEMRRMACSRGYLFSRKEWLQKTDWKTVEEALTSRSVLGYRIDVIDIMEVIRSWLPLVDQDERDLPAFMGIFTQELDKRGLLEDRRSLATLIDDLVNSGR